MSATESYSPIQWLVLCAVGALALIILSFCTVKVHRLHQRALREYPLSATARWRFALQMAGWYGLSCLAIIGGLLALLALTDPHLLGTVAGTLICLLIPLLFVIGASSYFNLWLLGNAQARSDPNRPK